MKQIDLKGVQSVVSQWPRNYRLLTVQQHCGSIEISLRQVPLDNDTHTCTIQHLYGSLGAVFPYTQRRQLSNESPVSNLAPIGSSTRASRKIHHRSEEHTSELQSLMRNSYPVFCFNKKKINQ